MKKGSIRREEGLGEGDVSGNETTWPIYISRASRTIPKLSFKFISKLAL